MQTVSRQLRKLITTIVLILMTTSIASAVEVTVFGVGADLYCSDYNKSTDKFSYNQWAEGFVSGAAAYNWANYLAGRDGVQLVGWISKYCVAHPEDMFHKAANQAYKTNLGTK